MKKVFALLLAVALVGGVAFADGVTIGAWGRGIASVFGGNGDKYQGFQAAGWGWGQDTNTIRTGFTVAGSTDQIGFQVDLNADGGAPGIGDEAKIWAKPIDMLRLTIGKLQDNTLRGDLCYGMFNWLRTGAGGLGEDLTFDRINTTGFELALQPIDALYINFAIPMYYQSVMDAGDMYKQSQVGLGFTIGDIGKIKAQYKGEIYGTNPDTGLEDTQYHKVGVAFDLTAVDSLYVTVGFKGQFGDAANLYHTIAFGVGFYGIDIVNIYALGNFDLDDDLGMKFGVGADIALGKDLTVIADVRYQNESASLSQAQSVGFLAGIEYGLGNGKIGIGFEGATGGVGFEGYTGTGNTDDFSFAVPVKFEYWF